jgi:hypothetical protein
MVLSLIATLIMSFREWSTSMVMTNTTRLLEYNKRRVWKGISCQFILILLLVTGLGLVPVYSYKEGGLLYHDYWESFPNKQFHVLSASIKTLPPACGTSSPQVITFELLTEQGQLDLSAWLVLHLTESGTNTIFTRLKKLNVPLTEDISICPLMSGLNPADKVRIEAFLRLKKQIYGFHFKKS